jgi:site-specific recombinase XerD
LPRQSTIDKQLKAWAKAAEIKKSVSMHKARHTFATLSLASGIDIYTTSKLLGHKNLATTQIYAQVIDEKKKRAVDMLPKI